jgi:hypothetical protein
VGLFRSEEEKQRKRHDGMLHSLTKGMRVVLPADPGRKRMLDALRQYNPLARHGLLGGFHADGGTLNLMGPTVIPPGLGAEALLPPDITVAYFARWYPHPVRGVSRREVDQEFREKAIYLLGGLAARFDGLSYPRPADVTGLLRADVYVLGEVDPRGLADLVSRHAPGPVRARPLRGAEMTAAVARYVPGVRSTHEWPDQGVVGLGGAGVPFEVEYWPLRCSSIPILAEGVKGSDPLAVAAKVLGAGKKSLLVVHAEGSAEGADPELARVVGAAALGVAGELGGVPMDLFGFRIRDPADLIIRRA